MGSFRRIAIPNDITPKFLQAAQRNTGLLTSISNKFYYILFILAQSIETCGILAGHRVCYFYIF